MSPGSRNIDPLLSLEVLKSLAKTLPFIIPLKPEITANKHLSFTKQILRQHLH
jgi:hypothetical protein